MARARFHGHRAAQPDRRLESNNSGFAEFRANLNPPLTFLVYFGAMDLSAFSLNLALLAAGIVTGLETRRRYEKTRRSRLGSGSRVADETAPVEGEGEGKKLPLLLDELRDAQRNDTLYLAFQPKLRARTGAIDSVEALLRWPHALGDIAPDQFIPLSEAHDEIAALTRWVVRRAVRDQAALAAAGFDLTVYINLSGRLLPDASFAGWLVDTIGERGKIGLEVTETAMIPDPEGALANLKRFADVGIRVAIDDYGAGFSSLAYLKRVPAQELKLDKMFISGLASSHRDPLLVRSTIDLAHALEMEVTAEGVESAAELALLRMMGCDLMQGFLISHPLPLDALIAFLGEYRTSAATPEDATAFFSGFGYGGS